VADLDSRGMIHRKIGEQHALVPADVHAEEWLRAIPLDKEVLITGRRARSPEHHRTFFGALHLIVENSDDWSDIDELLDAIKLSVGHVQRRQRLDGTVVIIPRSIDFASMGQDEFRRFCNRAKYVLSIVGIDMAAYMNEVVSGQRPRRRTRGKNENYLMAG